MPGHLWNFHDTLIVPLLRVRCGFNLVWCSCEALAIGLVASPRTEIAKDTNTLRKRHRWRDDFRCHIITAREFTEPVQIFFHCSWNFQKRAA